MKFCKIKNSLSKITVSLFDKVHIQILFASIRVKIYMHKHSYA